MNHLHDFAKTIAGATSDNILNVLLQSLERRPIKRIAISTMDALTFFNIDDILHLEAWGNYTVISFCDHPKITASKTLKDFEDTLPSETFFRIHHSHLVNINYIRKYIKGEGGQIELINGQLIDVSRRKKEEFMQAIKHFV